MRRMKLIMALLIGSFLPSAGMAQTLAFDRTQLVATCTASPSSCGAAVRAVIATLKAAGLSEAALNSQLGAVAGSVIEAAQTTTSVDFSGFGDAIAVVADASTDAAQAASIRGVVASVVSGDIGDLGANVATGAAFGSSPG